MILFKHLEKFKSIKEDSSQTTKASLAVPRSTDVWALQLFSFTVRPKITSAHAGMNMTLFSMILNFNVHICICKNSAMYNYALTLDFILFSLTYTQSSPR